MAKVQVLLEFAETAGAAFESFALAASSDSDADRQATRLVAKLSGLGLELHGGSLPVPMLSSGKGKADAKAMSALAAFPGPQTNPDLPAHSTVVAAELERSNLDALTKMGGFTVWPNSPLTLLGEVALRDLAPSSGGVDCRPFRPGVEIDTIREMLGTAHVWAQGFHGQNIVVGIIDEGVNGVTYPVIGGFSRPNAGLRPGAAEITSHGSMCAADILVAAPTARLYDYPFLGVPSSGGALQMFQAVLDQRRLDGTPHLTNNSYGFVGVPDREQMPGHEVHDSNHPVHRKVREVVASGAACFFAAGNCGLSCPSGACHPSGIGPGISIHASNSLAEVITVAAVNSRNERIGYSSQGPGMFEPHKPDIASYSHLFGNFGPGRPGGLGQPFDNGTSAATPVAAGVGALLLSGFPGLTPEALKDALTRTATDLGSQVGFDHDHGHGVINAAAAYEWLRRQAAPGV